jgi:hypothetical protein
MRGQKLSSVGFSIVATIGARLRLALFDSVCRRFSWYAALADADSVGVSDGPRPLRCRRRLTSVLGSHWTVICFGPGGLAIVRSVADRFSSVLAFHVRTAPATDTGASIVDASEEVHRTYDIVPGSEVRGPSRRLSGSSVRVPIPAHSASLRLGTRTYRVRRTLTPARDVLTPALVDSQRQSDRSRRLRRLRLAWSPRAPPRSNDLDSKHTCCPFGTGALLDEAPLGRLVSEAHELGG